MRETKGAGFSPRQFENKRQYRGEGIKSRLPFAAWPAIPGRAL
jgi:hypothetical protein